VWVSVPKGTTVIKGDTITFTATFKRAEGDPSFAFGSRPELTTPGAAAPVAEAPVKPRWKSGIKGAAHVSELQPEAAAPSILASLLAELEG
jgi:hypothetical protein